MKYFKEFIGQIDIWAINDGLCQNLKIAKKHPQEVMEFLKPYINSSNEWEIRVVAVILLSHFINDTYVDETLNILERLKRLADAGHKPLLLIGGATGRIGDPRPTTEREMKSIEEIEHNIEGLTKQAKDLFGFEVVNNYDWSKDINFIDFL